MDGFSPLNAGVGSLLLDDPFILSELMNIDGYTDLCSPPLVDQGVPSFGLPAQLMVQQSWSPLMPLNNLMQMNSDGSFDTTGVSPSDRGRPMNSPSNFVSVDSGMKGKENSFVAEDVTIPRSLSVSFSLADKMLRALSLFKESSGGGILAQVWVPLKHGNDYILSTCEQPYLLDGLLAGYREVSRAFTFSARESPDSFPGLPGRVFISRMPEWTTNVIYYSKAEYLRVNHAITHEVRGSLAVPVFDPHDRSCHAVLELVTTIEKSNFDPEMENVCRALRAVDLMTTEVRPHSQNLSRSQRAAIAEIVDVLRAVCHAHMLPLALTWVPSCCEDAVTGECVCDSVKERSIDLHRKSLLRIEESACYVNDATMHGFVHACFEHHLKQGQGIAGKALQSNHPFFSPDVKGYDILDYPLAHHARKFGLNAAVAIRLRSTYTGSGDYILEFFLPVNCRGSAEQQLLLNNLSVTMQKICRSLRTVSDAEIGIFDNKECIPKGSGLCFPSTGISGRFSQSEPSTCGPPSRNENKGYSGTGEDTCHGQTARQKSEKKRSTAEKNISLSILQQYFSGSLKDAAKAIGVCPTTLKRICRQHGISRWPSRKINKVNRSLKKIQNVINSVQGVEGALKFDPVSGRLVSAVSNLEPPRDINASSPKKQFVGKLEPEECLGPVPNSTTNDVSLDRNTSSSSMGAEQTAVAELNHSDESATTESSNGTTSSSPDFKAALHHRKPVTTGEVLVVKATYKDDTVRFKFSPTMGCLHLFEEVGRRFKLLTGTFQLKYLDDEEEWVMLATESDLQECVEVLECGGTRNLKLLVKDLPCSLGSSASSNCLSMGS
ncbi:Protein NLP2 [Acorus calamus]|uniref:Protein NLP2 n=1 Tax=Acorus calamus TaxID=4465 RepID=A0AAV9F244_ACOCL|nr:Protein NLP2 [Acorus calamus]